ncbi:RabGAP/TBC [Aulographum hederae CBS 113979]|uniref:GTPase-activating protein GYP5 n=1 Tax=Aulographum hederae CBS 113979 TaxID=1176131 RepID=A0A6G1HDU7_9PEZI|nr:RabGAP/TBC [Aulographum hederae CBS 113979]
MQDIDTFDDAPEMTTPRPVSTHTARSTSRSLTRRESDMAETREETPATPASPPIAEDGDEDVDTMAEETVEKKSPLLTSHRISVESGMDDVSLEEDSSSANRSSTTSAAAMPPPPIPPRTDSIPVQQGLSGPLPPLAFPPPPPIPEKDIKPPPPPSAAPSRKLTSPFSWLSRNTTTADKRVASPPPAATVTKMHDRRDTVSTIGSNQDMMLNRIDDGDGSEGSRLNTRNSLRDRFKILRMREEAGITDFGGDENAANGQGSALAGLIGRSASIGLGLGSPTSISEDKELGNDAASVRGPASPTARSPDRRPSINAQLAPGTAMGMSAGPAADAEPVDWDLWQSVVYEGPAAVARTSAEELNHAIASGIPQAIRGVVWQVLAQSKNEELEAVYRELVNRGTDKEGLAPGALGMLRQNSSGNVSGSIKERESIRSSASSIHSDHSVPVTNGSHANGATTPLPQDDTLDRLRHTLIGETRKKRSSMDAAAMSKLEKAIKRDLGARTSYSKYLMSAGLQDGLFGICKAYALFDEGVGYAQGMNFIAMPLLFNMPEEEAFSLFVKLMTSYRLREMFIPEMPGLHCHLYQFSRLLEDLEPALYCHLHRRGVEPQLYATQWFLTLFAYRFPLQLVLRIYDLILSEGLEGAILKFGIVLMQKNKEALMAMKDMAALTTFLKEKIFDVYIDKSPSASSILDSGFFGSAGGVDKEVYRADVLVRDACAVKVTPAMLKLYATEWKEQTTLEKDRETELETLRAQTSSLTLKVRSLEERAEKSDIEHINLASDLVRTKVDNETLTDENESLKGQVEELRRVVETQTEEVEKRLQAEMDGVMKRNMEVHNENRGLEEQLQEMEKVLVEVKMNYAQVNSEHEGLKQKWNNISQMMGQMK